MTPPLHYFPKAPWGESTTSWLSPGCLGFSLRLESQESPHVRWSATQASAQGQERWGILYLVHRAHWWQEELIPQTEGTAVNHLINPSDSFD